jgi:hypothetical protein
LLFNKFEADRALSCDDVNVVVGRDVALACLLTLCAREQFRRDRWAVDLYQLCAERLDRRHLHG